MSKVSFAFRYAGEALDDGLLDVRDLAPAMLALGDLCEQANFQVNGTEAKATVQIRAVAPGSFVVEFYLVVGLLRAVRKLFNAETLRNAHEVFELVKDTVETVKALKGRKIDKVTELADGSKRLTVEHRQTFDLPPELSAMLMRRAVQDDLAGIIRPLQAEGVDRLEILQGNKVVETVDSDDVDSFEALATAFPLVEENEDLLVTPSIIEGTFRVVTVSSDPRKRWTFRNAGNSYNVKVDDKGLFQMAKEGHLGIEPGFIVRVRIRSEIRFVRGEQRIENYLVRVLDVNPPEPHDDGSNPLPLGP
jgi:hypothetical protein